MLGINNFEVEIKHFERLSPEVYGEAATFPWMSERIKIEALYETLVEAQREEIEEIKRDDLLALPYDLDYLHTSLALSIEEKEKLALVRPASIGSASRIPGITPNAIVSLLRFVKKQNQQQITFAYWMSLVKIKKILKIISLPIIFFVAVFNISWS